MMMTTTLKMLLVLPLHTLGSREPRPRTVWDRRGEGGLDGLNLWPRLPGRFLVGNEWLLPSSLAVYDCCWCQCWCWCWWRRW